MGFDQTTYNSRGAAPRPKRLWLYRVGWHLAHWPMMAVGLFVPARMARLATWWIHYCGFLPDHRVVAVNRYRYALLPRSRPAPEPYYGGDGA